MMIQLTDVTKSYDKTSATPALNVSLAVPAGQFVAVMGPSGSGKSTLLNLIAGLDRPTTGSVSVHGMSIGTLGEAALARYRRSQLGFVYQFFNLLNQLTVLDNVMLPAQLAGTRNGMARRQAMELLAQVGMEAKAGEYPAKLSGGQRQRVAIVRALINRPPVLLADEPTGALDTRSGEDVLDLLATIHRGGQTIVLVTHDAKLAASYAERIVTLRDGRVVDDALMTTTAATDRPAELLSPYRGEE
jgi:putative ABC transport system ATP-binding protein